MPLVKANRFWNYKTFDLTKMKGPEFIDQLGGLLDEAGRNGWELAYMCEDFMILKQLYEQK